MFDVSFLYWKVKKLIYSDKVIGEHCSLIQFIISFEPTVYDIKSFETNYKFAFCMKSFSTSRKCSNQRWWMRMMTDKKSSDSVSLLSGWHLQITQLHQVFYKCSLFFVESTDIFLILSSTWMTTEWKRKWCERIFFDAFKINYYWY